MIALAIAYSCYRIKHGSFWPLGWFDVGFVVIEAIFLLASRDTIAKYYSRGTQLLGTTTPSGITDPEERV